LFVRVILHGNDGIVLKIVSVYAPQTQCTQQKDSFLERSRSVGYGIAVKNVDSINKNVKNAFFYEKNIKR